MIGSIDGELYAEYILKMLHTIISVGTDSNGDPMYRS